MPVVTATLMDGSEVSLIYLGKASQPRSALTYLHSVKSGSAQLFMEEFYRRKEVEFARALADEVQSAAQPFDAFLVPPTRYPNLVAPYASAIRERFPGTPDLTTILERRIGASFGRAKAYDEVRDALFLRGDRPLPSGMGQLLIVDDVFAHGWTASAVQSLLRTHGLINGVVIACPLIADEFG
jgi:predicted amidophosphoribosyltransferase